MRPVSVVVVSRGRPEALMRCLTGLSQVDYAPFEIVTVACPAGVAAVQARPDADHIKLIPFDEANISAARNLGIDAAAGEIVAFIDDDAVPEPLWLRHLTAPFDTGADAVGGYVIGRNGISFQWTARSVDVLGQAHPLDITGTDPVVPQLPPLHALKTEGTNMAVRREVLAALGGFDPAFHFYLDETDLNLRLAAEGHTVALAPLAQVHHGFAESERRTRDRTPKDLTQIAASQRVFLRKHAPAKQHKPAWKAFRTEQRLRLLRLMQRGPLGPDDVMRLMAGLRKGGKQGETRAFGDTPPRPEPTQDFLPYPSRLDAPRVTLAGRIWQRKALRAQARDHAAKGDIPSVYLFTSTTQFHRVWYDFDGFWQQSGGLFGRSIREGTFFRFRTFSSRLRIEQARVAAVRGE
ncbi:glycosyltransferase family 2 protein [Tropicibacter naphthalenivorans]|uniref:Mycofactocin system glycosyltransferase n=1 Tax=Tropicibacter naphthalenivorans TaxID=441103 RepID=A0A0P1GCY5_9RHOB|nr:glycosyltransferase [Tropicibacter naphthalenivorans]CUH79269.1 mycofactocin system glycosyltransferase [Tropicibacter naphthalenivorans]SMC71005.1 Glycosyltransferase, GT2 family [Tropicibacter naphthalenivorans]